MLNRELIKNITDLRTDPILVFQASKKKQRPLYIFNRSEPLGVVMDWDEYEKLEQKLEDLIDILDLREARAESKEELVDWKETRGRLVKKLNV